MAVTVDKDSQAVCNGVAGSTAASVNNINYTASRVESVSSFDKSSTLNNHSSALETSIRDVPTTTQETKRTPYDSTTNERINSFDKDKVTISNTAGTTAAASSSMSTTVTISSNTGALKNGSKPEGFSSISSRTLTTTTSASSSYTTSSNIITSDKGDDNVKDRYNTQQGIRDQSQTGRFGTQPSSASGATVSSTTASSSGEAKMQEFGRTKRSSSDAELIFGDKSSDFYKPRFSTTGLDFKKSNDSLTDAELIFGTSAVSGPPSVATGSTFHRFSSYGSRDSSNLNNTDSDNTYGKKEDRNNFSKSMSVSYEKSDSNAADRFRAAPKAYEPPKIAASTAGSSSAGSRAWNNKYDDDDFDLK